MNKSFLILILLIFSIYSYGQTATDYYKRAVNKYKNKEYAVAIIEYTRAIDKRPNAAVLYNNRGICKYKLERFSEAISDYEQAIKLDANYKHAYFNKGNSHLGVLEFDAALLSYDKTLELDSFYFKAYPNRAKVFYHFGDYKASIKDLNKAIESRSISKPEKLYLQRANAEMALEKYDNAIDDYTQAISENADYYKAYINRGQCYFKMENYEKAIDDFTLSMRLDPSSGEGYFYRGLVYIAKTSGVKAQKKDKNTVALIKENKVLISMACSDFNKAKSFSYERAYEAIKEYCDGVKIKKR